MGGHTDMKTLVAYFSQTGNTKRVAEAIFEELPSEKEIKEVSEIKDTSGYDLLFVGFPIHGFGPAKPGAEFLANQCQGKAVGLFVTHAAPEYSEPLKEWLRNCRDATAGTQLKGVFNCQGELSEIIAEQMLKSGDSQLEAWAKERPSTVGQPDESRLEKARAFAREMTP